MAKACTHERTKRHGHDRRGKQRLRCLDCGVSWSEPDPTIEDRRCVDEDRLGEVIEMFCQDASIRQVAEQIGISRGTAHDLQKYQHCTDFAFGGSTRVLTGKRADGSFSYYDTEEIQPQWRKQRYGDETDFE